MNALESILSKIKETKDFSVKLFNNNGKCELNYKVDGSLKIALEHSFMKTMSFIVKLQGDYSNVNLEDLSENAERVKSIVSSYLSSITIDEKFVGAREPDDVDNVTVLLNKGDNGFDTVLDKVITENLEDILPQLSAHFTGKAVKIPEKPATSRIAKNVAKNIEKKENTKSEVKKK